MATPTTPKTLAEALANAQDSSGNESEKWKRFKDMFDPTTAINLKTDLRRKDIDRMNTLEMLDDFLVKYWLIDLELKADTQREKEMLVSHERGGRKEGFAVLKQDIQVNKEKSPIEKALGIG